MLPWKETSAESERLRFIERVIAGEEPVTELCRQSGISRKTGYKLIHRYEAHGKDGLLDRSRAPHHHPNATAAGVAERIIEAKRAHPTWGPKKLVAWLRDREPDAPWPAHSTAGGILVRTTDGVRIDPLTAQDAMSRFLLVCDGLARPAGPEVRRVLERAFRDYGLPGSSALTTDRPSPASAWAASHLSPHGGSSWGSSPSASIRDTPNRTGASSASTAPSRRRRRRRPRPTGDGSGEPSTASGTATTTSDLTRPWDSADGPALHPLVPALSRTQQLAGIRGRGHSAPGAPQRRDQVEGRAGLRERVPQGRAHRPRPARRAHLVNTVWTAPHRRPRPPRTADRQDPGTRVTYVPGLTVPMCPVAQGDRY